LRTEPLFVPAFCVWKAKSKKFQIIFSPPLELCVTGNSDEDIRQATQQMTTAIEKFRTPVPDQWLVDSPPWKTRRRESRRFIPNPLFHSDSRLTSPFPGKSLAPTP